MTNTDRPLSREATTAYDTMVRGAEAAGYQLDVRDANILLAAVQALHRPPTTTIPAEPGPGSFLTGFRDGRVAGAWHRPQLLEDPDDPRRWFSTYIGSPTSAFTWAQAYERGARTTHELHHTPTPDAYEAAMNALRSKTAKVAELETLVSQYRGRGDMTPSTRQSVLGEDVEQSVEPERTAKRWAVEQVLDEFSDSTGINWQVRHAIQLGLPVDLVLQLFTAAGASLHRYGRLVTDETLAAMRVALPEPAEDPAGPARRLVWRGIDPGVPFTVDALLVRLADQGQHATMDELTWALRYWVRRGRLKTTSRDQYVLPLTAGDPGDDSDPDRQDTNLHPMGGGGVGGTTTGRHAPGRS